MSFPRCFVLLAALLLASPLSAAVPGQVNYQGLLLDDQGQPVTGNVDLAFALFDAASGGSALWSEAHADVAVLDGVYDVVLGSSTPLTPPLVAGGALYLEIEVEGETLAPRQRLVAVPYALRASEAENLQGTSGAFFTEMVEHFAFDGGDPPNEDPREGTGDTDGDGLANFLDADNDGDGLSDQEELGLGADINLVTPAITGFDPAAPVEASLQSTVTVQGTNFEPGIAVTFGTQSPTPQNLTATSFDVVVGPQPEGTAPVVVTRANGESASASYAFLDPTPVVTSLVPALADASATTLVTVNGSGFLSTIDVAFGSESPTPQNLTETSFQVSVGPQPPGAVDVVVSLPSGRQDSAEFVFFDDANPKLVFATSTLHTGDLGGLAGGDAICNAAATAASLPGTYLAWLGDGSDAPASRFTKGAPYALVNGTPVAEHFLDLADGTLLNPIDRDESGSAVTASTPWTGVAPDGTSSPGADCLNWSSASGGFTGATGSTTTSGTGWTQTGPDFCDTPQRLYCFQQ